MDNKKAILIVEDEFLIAMDLEDSLRDQGYDVVGPASTVTQAMTLIEAQAVAAAVLDYNLKDGTSEALATQLIAQSIPVVFLSGDSLANRPEALQSCLVLSKPVSLTELAEALKDRL